MFYVERLAKQTAFQVVVWENLDFTDHVWDSNKVISEKDNVRYSGPALKSGNAYFWKVRWWDHHGNIAESEETGHFLMGILNVKDWNNIPWIAAPPSITTAPLFMKNVSIDPKTVTRAILYVSGLGFCKPFVNGNDLNARFDPPIALIPGWTNYRLRVPYSMYNVTNEILQAKSTETKLEILLGIGWRNRKDYPRKDPHIEPHPDSIPRVLRVKLHVEFTNQSIINVAISDSSWSVTSSGIVQDSIYLGETYNASISKDPHRPKLNALVTDGPNGQMYLPGIPPIVEVGIEKPIKIYDRKDKNGIVMSQIVDFGNNSAGYCLINVKGSTHVTIHHAEVPMHPPYGEADGSLYYDNLQGASQLDTIISDGTLETYKPSFTYHGFRYAEITGLTLTENDIQKIVIHTNVELNGEVTTSSQILNAIQASAVRSQSSNLMSVPTDCDQRDERLGWMGDAGLSSYSMMLNFHMADFYVHYLKLIRDELISGTLPDVVPYYRYGARPADPAWGDAFIEILVWYGLINKDQSVWAEYFNDTYRYITTLAKKIPPEGIGKLYSYYGDWVPPPGQPKVNGSFVSAFCLINGLKDVESFALILNKTDDVKSLDELFGSTHDAFIHAFMTKDGCFLNKSQASYVLPLALGFWNANDGISIDFVNSFKGRDHSHMTSGIIGARQIFDVLVDIVNQRDLALELAEQVDYPSWGYMIYNPYEPATGMWELWNSHNGSAVMNSRNHHMFSSISSYVRAQAAGLVLPKGTCGFDTIQFRPASTLGLSYSTVTLQFPKTIYLSWQRNGGIQCSKSPENQSPMSPTLPKHDGLFVSCGNEEGGTIAIVKFASFGNPIGHCGGYYEMGSCHASNSIHVVEKLCLGKRKCNVPTGVDFWGDPCPGESKWLVVEVHCQSKFSQSVPPNPEYKFSSLTVNVSVPVGSNASLFLPAYGKKSLQVWDGDTRMYDIDQGLKYTPGVTSSYWDVKSDSLVLNLETGYYNFTVRGDVPTVYCVDSFRSFSDGIVVIGCDGNTSEVITSIDWVSYGSPITKNENCIAHQIGDCHAGSSRMIVEKCMGLRTCEIAVTDTTFGKINCIQDGKKARLVAEYVCAPRP